MHNIRNADGRNESPYRFFNAVNYSLLESRQWITATAARVAAALDSTEKEMKELLDSGKRVLENTRNFDERFSVEDERQLVTNYEDAEEGFLEIIHYYTEMETDAICDSDLDGRNELLVTAGFRRVIKLQKDVFNIIQEIRWAIMENVQGVDEDATSEDIEDLIARL